MKYLINLFIIALIFSSCESKKEREERAALSLLTQAGKLVESHSNQDALIFLDSIHKNYPRQISIRKQADVLQDTIEWRISKRNLIYCDSLKSLRENEFERLSKHFIFEKNDSYQEKGIYTHKIFNTTKATNVVPYFDENGDSFLKIMYNGNNLGISGISITSSNRSIESPNNGDGNYHQFKTDGQNFERFIISGGSAKSVLLFICENQSPVIQIKTRKKSIQHQLSKMELGAYSQTVEFAKVYTELQNLNKEIKRLNNKLFTIEAK